MSDNFWGDAFFTTVGELRVLLEAVPATTRITISPIPEGDAVTSLCLLSTTPRGAELPNVVPIEDRSGIVAVCICEVGEWSHDDPQTP